ncbi:class IV adenylate cyclase [Halocatena marina]|uniref:Class IV adenylate cyclase n=2 Tax=Halocatena marina TaxID=2934937 RepID=A0ABD5YUS4_9EURY
MIQAITNTRQYDYIEWVKKVKMKIALTEEQATDLRADLAKRGSVEEMTETDIYYTAPIRDFLETNECLRIRIRDSEPVELTYKGETTPEMREQDQFWKNEVDIPIEDTDDVQHLLEAIGCEEVTTVVKHRSKVRIDETVITLDDVEGIDHYLEIERTASTEEEVAQAVQSNRRLLSELGIDQPDIVDEPYRDLVLASQ